MVAAAPCLVIVSCVDFDGTTLAHGEMPGWEGRSIFVFFACVRVQVLVKSPGVVLGSFEFLHTIQVVIFFQIAPLRFIWIGTDTLVIFHTFNVGIY